MAKTRVLQPRPVSATTCHVHHVPTTMKIPKPTSNQSLKRKLSSSMSPVMSDKITAMASSDLPNITFDATKHLNYFPPEKIWTMAEIGKENVGVSPNAVSEPFPLFTEDAIKQMRAEILSKPVLENCQYSSNLAPCQLRGMAPTYAPFVHDAWKSPEVLSIMSQIAGVELVPVMDFEIANINVSINDKDAQEAAKQHIAEYQSRQADEGVAGCPWEDETPVVDWHTDSYPFVCVVMLSDCTEMIGGETALRTGTGEIMKVRGPGMGNAVILQGRYIEHVALKGYGGPERITMVTSFRPKSPLVKDDSVLTTVRAISDLSELYGGFAEYRLEILEERVRAELKKLRDNKKRGRRFDTAGVKSFLQEQQSFLEATCKQIIDEDQVIPGFTDTSHLVSEELRVRAKQRDKGFVGEEV